MFSIRNRDRRREDRPIHVFRWAARVLSVLSTAVLLMFIFGARFQVTQIGAREWLGLIFFPLGVVLGFAVGWWREGLGGSLTILSLLAFYVVYGYLLRGNIVQGWAFVVFAFPGLLFLVSWLLASARDRGLGAPKRDSTLRHSH